MLDRAGGVSHEIRGVATHDSHVESLSDRGLGEVVVARDSDSVDGTFILVGFAVGRWVGTHEEGAVRD